ncbi:putative RNA polymerase II subunit B1 CTD phosphatase Rpap2 isoform X2 [Patiria miniata]|nr:putative RNA polymerase II subunit B1 CTD phosphatase Rpap2 isoform X2 [Patiria miniata]
MLEERVQRRLVFEKKAHEIVETLLDNPITDEFLLDCAFAICPQHYQDVVIERSIVKQCGYPLCQRSLQNVPQQKYHISRKTNKVYDITDRKCFCSQFCYKASKFFEAQLSDSPLWTRDMEEPLDIKLLTRDMEADATAASLIAKDNVVFTERVESQDVDEVGGGEKDTPLKEEAVGLLEDDLSNLTFADTRKRERLQELAEVSRLPTTSHAEQKQTVTRKDSSESSQQAVLNQNQEVCLPTVLPSRDDSKDSHAREEIKTRQLRDLKSEENLRQGCSENRGESKSEDTPSNVTADIDASSPGMDLGIASEDLQGVKKKKSKKKPKKSSAQVVKEASLLQSVSRTFVEWITNDTQEFLTEGASSKVSDDSGSVNLAESNLTCDPLAMTSDPSVSTTEPSLPAAKPLPCMDKLKEETEQFSLKVQEFYYGRHLEVKKKEKKAKSGQEKQEEDVDRTIRLPLVDSKSQMAIRRKILSDRLNRTYSEILTPLRLSMRDMSTDLQSLIRTFNLSSTNITFKPAGWTMMSLLLLQM